MTGDMLTANSPTLVFFTNVLLFNDFVGEEHLQARHFENGRADRCDAGNHRIM